MAGLVQQATQQQPPAAPDAGAAAGAQPQGQGRQPDQNQVRAAVMAASKIIHDKAVMPQLVSMMKQAGDPATALAQAAILVMQQVNEKLKGAIAPEALGTAGIECMQMLGALAQSAGLFKFTMEIFQAAVKAAMQILQQQGGGAPAPGQGAAPAAPAAPDAGGQPTTVQ